MLVTLLHNLSFFPAEDTTPLRTQNLLLCLQLSYQPPAVYRDMTTGLFPNAWQSRTVDTPALEDMPCLSQITVWQDKPHLPKISNLPWIMEALQSFFF